MGHLKPCAVTLRRGGPSPQPFAQHHVQPLMHQFRWEASSEKPNLWPHFSMACSTPKMLFAGTVENSGFENPGHNNNCCCCCWGLLVFFFSHRWRIFGIHESVSLRDICFKGPLLWANPALFAPLFTEDKHECINYAGKKKKKINEGSEWGFTETGFEGWEQLSSATASDS